jgi:hypothetical protein
MDNKTTHRISDSDLELLVEPQRGTYIKPVAIGAAVLVLAGMVVLMTRTSSAVPAVVAAPAPTAPAAEPAAEPRPSLRFRALPRPARSRESRRRRTR